MVPERIKNPLQPAVNGKGIEAIHNINEIKKQLTVSPDRQ
jgi:hypothetical protein